MSAHATIHQSRKDPSMVTVCLIHPKGDTATQRIPKSHYFHVIGDGALSVFDKDGDELIVYADGAWLWATADKEPADE